MADSRRPDCHQPNFKHSLWGTVAKIRKRASVYGGDFEKCGYKGRPICRDGVSRRKERYT